MALLERRAAPLAEFVASLRARTGYGTRIPDFDPWDGGVEAECLFLLEAPGPKAVQSGFVSRNNPDESARNFWQLNREAELPRELTVTWNIVPWYVGTGAQIRAVTTDDITLATPYLVELLVMLTKVRVIVLVGRKAERARELLTTRGRRYSLLRCPHPSPKCLNGRPERRDEIVRCCRSVLACLRPEPVRCVL